MLGQAVVRPGRLSRTQSLLLAGREAARICLGVAGMLVLAAVIESYVRQSHWSTTTRLVFAAGTGVFWVAYIAHGFYRERQDKNLLAKMPVSASETPPTERQTTASSAGGAR